MKKLTLILLLSVMILAIAPNTSNVDFCITRTNHSPITASSNTTISADSINAGGAAVPCITIPANSHDIHITHCMLLNSHYELGAIFVGANCTNITIDYNYIGSSYMGVAVGNGSTGNNETNIIIRKNRIYYIQDAPGHPAGKGSSIQLNTVNHLNVVINSNDIYFPGLGPDVGDVISIFKTFAQSGHTTNLQVDSNNIEGGSSDPTGKAGIVLGDVGGSYQEALYNNIKNSGFIGAQVQGGTFINMSYNNIFSVQNSISGGGLVYGNYSGSPSTNITMGNNKINWTTKEGTIFNKNVSSGTTPTNWTTNTATSTADFTVLSSLLPDPLWSACVIPPNFSYYSISLVYGSPMVVALPSNTGGAPTSYSGTLPAGLSLNAVTGAIMGTPTAAAAMATYHITGTNSSGSSTANVVITVNPASLIVAASPRSKLFGAANPSFAVTYSQWALSDGPLSLLTPVVITAHDALGNPVTTFSPVGWYYISPSGATSNNYAITFQDGVLAVDQGPTVRRVFSVVKN